MGEPLITRADLPAFRDLILDYQRWRKAKGLPESDFWGRKLRAALEEMELLKPRAKREQLAASTQGSES